jgi:dienelactone hydrolase
MIRGINAGKSMPLFVLIAMAIVGAFACSMLRQVLILNGEEAPTKVRGGWPFVHYLNERLTYDDFLSFRSASGIPPDLKYRILQTGLPEADVNRTLSEIFSLPDWAIRFNELAESYEKEADRKTLENPGGESKELRNNWRLMAALAWHFATLPHVYDRLPFWINEFENQVESDLLLAIKMEAPMELIWFPFESKMYSAIYIPPKAARHPCPFLLIQSFGTYTKEELAFSFAPLARNFALVVVDSPGTILMKTPLNSAKQIAEMGKSLVQFLSIQRVCDVNRFAVLGIGMAGNMAFHMAAGLPGCKGVIAISAPYSPADLLDQVPTFVKLEYERYTDRTGEFMRIMLSEFNLDFVLPKIKCPVFLIATGKDPFAPAMDSIRIYNKVTGKKTLMLFQGSYQGAASRRSEWEPVLLDFLNSNVL